MTMFIHCKPYICNKSSIFLAVFLMLLGFLYASADTITSPSPKLSFALLGDSMTWIGGDSCQNPTGWSHHLKESGMAGKIDVYARSGATWTNTISTKRNTAFYSEILHDDNVVYNQTIRLIEKADSCQENPDIIILFAGANDAWFAAKRPGIYEGDNSKEKFSLASDPASLTSLDCSLLLLSDILKERFPDSTLLFVTPLQMSKTDAETIFRVSDIIEKVANKKGCLVLRADKETGITHQQESSSPTYTYDGVHTNPAGAQLLANFILLSLKNLTTPNPQLIADN